MGLSLITPPSFTPVTLDEVKLFIRVDASVGSSEDTLITSLIETATHYAETITGRQLAQATWEYTMDMWLQGREIYLPKPPLRSVSYVKYITIDNIEHTIDPSLYVVDNVNIPGRIVLRPEFTFPAESLIPANGIRIGFISGYATASDIPREIRHAILLLVSHWYEYRGVVVDSVTSVREIPFAVDALLLPYRVYRWF